MDADALPWTGPKRLPGQRTRSHVPHVWIGGEERKSCSRCGSLKPLSEFWVARAKTDGLDCACKACQR